MASNFFETVLHLIYLWSLFRLKHSVSLKIVFFTAQHPEYESRKEFEKSCKVSNLASSLNFFLLKKKERKPTKNPPNPQTNKQTRREKTKFMFNADLALLFLGWSHASPWSVRSYHDFGNSNIWYSENLTLKDLSYYLEVKWLSMTGDMICLARGQFWHWLTDISIERILIPGDIQNLMVRALSTLI